MCVSERSSEHMPKIYYVNLKLCLLDKIGFIRLGAEE